MPMEIRFEAAGQASKSISRKGAKKKTEQLFFASLCAFASLREAACFFSASEEYVPKANSISPARYWLLLYFSRWPRPGSGGRCGRAPVVAACGFLRDLSSQFCRQQQRRYRRPQRRHFQVGLFEGPGSGCHLADSVLSLAASGFWLRRFRLREYRSDVRHA